MENIHSKFDTHSITLITPTLDGGVGRVIYQLAKNMRQYGINISIWTISGGAYEKDISKFSQVLHLQSKRKRARETLFSLIKLVRDRKPDVVLSFSFHVNCLVIIAKIFSFSQLRLFVSEHTSLQAAFQSFNLFKKILFQTLIRLLYKKADGVIAISEEIQSQIHKYSGVPKQNIYVKYNPVITQDIFNLSNDPIDSTAFKENVPTLLAVGRLSIEKDYLTMLNAFKEVLAKRLCRLLIIGSGPEESHLKTKIKELDIEDHVSLLGHITNPYPYFKHCSLYVLSSTREGVPTTIIEALALNTPVVSTDALCGPREILQNGKYGKLVPIKNSGELAKKILETLQEGKKNIPKEAIEKYQADTSVHEYLKILFPDKFNWVS